MIFSFASHLSFQGISSQKKCESQRLVTRFDHVRGTHRLVEIFIAKVTASRGSNISFTPSKVLSRLVRENAMQLPEGVRMFLKEGVCNRIKARWNGSMAYQNNLYWKKWCRKLGGEMVTHWSFLTIDPNKPNGTSRSWGVVRNHKSVTRANHSGDTAKNFSK